MGSGNKGLYSGAYSGSVPGSAYYMKPSDNFSKYIKRRKDKDANGFYDIIAHGGSNRIEIFTNGKTLLISHREAAQLFKKNPEMRGKSIRLLSCDTGSDPKGFAQNLANKLNVVVEAPTKLVWANPNGSYYVAGGKMQNGRLVPVLSDKGKFSKFYPGGKKK